MAQRLTPKSPALRGLCAAAFGLAALGFSPAARALVVNPRPTGALGDSDLQNLLSNGPLDSPPGIYVSGPVYDVVADQSPHAVFTPTASGGSVATFVIELTSFSGTNRFGIYDFVDPTKKVELFDGSDSPGSQTLVSFLADGSVLVLFVDSGVTDFSGQFGFYLDVYEAAVGLGGDGDPNTFDYTVFSEDSLNPGGKAQALIYQGNNATTLQIPPFSPGLFSSSSWIVAFEDLLVSGPSGGSSDRDFSDMVVLVESVVPAVDVTIPTVSEWGLAVMALLLLTGAKIYFGRLPATVT